MYGGWSLMPGPPATDKTTQPATATTTRPAPRLAPPAAFLIYVAGQAAILLAGSALLLRLHLLLASRIHGFVVGPALAALRRFRRTIWTMHLAYFGIFLATTVVSYCRPEIQRALQGQVQQASRQQGNPLAVAAKAYRSGNVWRAAGVTVAVNFLVGSLLYITVPSIIVPGLGLLLSLLRAILWGLVLTANCEPLARAMLPHTGTLLLEGHAYVLASFYALLVPVYLSRRGEGPTLLRRYGRAVLLNLRGSLLVLAVLVVAGVYEAAEVLWLVVPSFRSP